MSGDVYSIKCWFEGHVQGVGFRYQTVAIAKGYDVTGTVSNIDDGRVFIHAEGDQAEVTAFRAEIESEMSSFIRRTEVKNATSPRIYNGFSIS
ncbi:MAG: acylphosphatase [Coraliomargarita sp.]|nr:acylphosphatase [Coraliomargarita sp.]|tara:strand:- start:6111 stop:6389 length:279 start_codon:yes stop_codon:yes gene_type:complete